MEWGVWVVCAIAAIGAILVVALIYLIAQTYRVDKRKREGSEEKDAGTHFG